MESDIGEKRRKGIRVGSLSLLGSTGVTLAVGIILAGVLARYFSPAEFGLWSILMSLNGILINGFDLGFGNALRNRMAQGYGRASGEEQNRIYFFSIFYWFLLVAAILTGMFFFVKPSIPWNVLFNSTDPEMIGNGSSLVVIGASILAFNVAFNIYNSGFFAYQESHWNALLNSLSKLSLLCLTVVFVFSSFSFFFINITFFVITLGASVVSFLFFLRIREWPLRFFPLGTLLARVKELWKKSAQFALLQIFSTFLLNADYFVVSKVLGLETVGDYFLVKRIYLVLASFHFAILLPVWSAYTESVESRDFVWMERMLRKTVRYTILIFMGGIAGMLFAGDFIVYLWTGKKIDSLPLFLWLGVWGLIYGWNNCFSVFLNGTGHLKLQVVFVGIAAACFVPLALFLGERYGTLGVCWALIGVSLPVTISNPLQSFFVAGEYLKRKACPE